MQPSTAPSARRRRLLFSAGAALGALALGRRAVEGAPPPPAPRPLLLGELNVINKRTRLTGAADSSLLQVTNTGSGANRAGVVGRNSGADNVVVPPGPAGVYGLDTSDGNNGIAVMGRSDGTNGSGNGVGVYGKADKGGVGVRAESATGLALQVLGASAQSGPAAFEAGVTAASFTGNAAGLTGLTPAQIPGLDAAKIVSGRLPAARIPRDVARRTAKFSPFLGRVTAASFGGPHSGPPAFTTAGRATIPTGADRVFVRYGALAGNSVVATLQGDAGPGVAVKHVSTAPGGFVVVLTADAAHTIQVAYFILRGA